jgi:hypothetical protein
MNVNEENWLFQKMEEVNINKHSLKDENNLINLKWLMEYMW